MYVTRSLTPAGASRYTAPVPRLAPDVSAPDLPTAAAIEAEIRRLAVPLSAAELHGSLCGWLAGGGASDRGWLARVLAESEIPSVPEDGPLDRLRVASAAQLADRGFDFQLLLPEASASLSQRSGALFDWCRGFLGGFGLSAGAQPPLSEDSREALGDLARLAAAQPQEEGDEDDEAALAELEEFVRVAALLLHGDCVLAARHRQKLN